MRKLIIVLLMILLGSAFAQADDAGKFELTISQYDKSISSNVKIYRDTLIAVKDLTANGFAGPMSFTIDLHSIDTVSCDFTVHVVTVGPPIDNYSKKFVAEFDLPAIINNITGKDSAKYTFKLIPLEKTEVDLTNCDFNHRRKKDFTFSPTAYTDIFFVESSLGEFYWDSVKELMEANFRQFQMLANFNLPGKFQLYLYPCPSYSIVWDKRFGTMIDPTRNAAYSIYNKNFNTSDPFVVVNLALMRAYGYSHPALSDGLGNVFSFADYEMKKIVDENMNVPLESLMNSFDYLSAEPSLTDPTVTTLVKYLTTKYGFEEFIEVYRGANNLTLKQSLEKGYGKSLAEIEMEWLNYVDTVTINSNQFHMYITQTEMMLNYSRMLEYSQAYLKYASNQFDSLESYKFMKRAHFFLGNYYGATEYQQKILGYTHNDAVGWMALGSYFMMNGANDSAFAYFSKAQEIDPTDLMINFNLGLYYINTGEPEKAKVLLEENLSNIKYAQTQGESRLFLANILSKSNERKDQERAAELYNAAANVFTQALQVSQSSPTLYLWLGISYLGLYDYSSAIDHLHMAEFIETRPFYIGMINLWLGKTYLANNDKDAAKAFFSIVIASPSSAVYHQNEARELLESLK